MSASPPPSYPPCHADAEVLLQFAAAARGDNARALADWREGTQPCRWSGVTCSAGGAVTTIKLPRAGLAGQLYPDLAQLSSLQHM